MSRKKSTLVRSSILGASVALHAWFAFGYAPTRPQPAAARSITEVDFAAIMPSPPPPPEVAPKTPEPEANPNAPRTNQQAASAPAKSLPPAAQAGRTLTAPEDTAPSEVMDFSLVQGEGTTYAGGTTTTKGISRTAVQGKVASIPTALGGNGSSSAPALAAKDLSRSPQPLNGNWDCSQLYPAGATPDFAIVRVVATVDAGGRVVSVAVLSDPGNGFGEAAKRCALRQQFSPGLNRSGQPSVKSTAPIRVRFSR